MELNVKDYNITTAWQEFPGSALFFVLMETSAPVDIEILRNNTPIGTALDVEEGLGVPFKEKFHQECKRPKIESLYKQTKSQPNIVTCLSQIIEKK